MVLPDRQPFVDCPVPNAAIVTSAVAAWWYHIELKSRAYDQDDPDARSRTPQPVWKEPDSHLEAAARQHSTVV